MPEDVLGRYVLGIILIGVGLFIVLAHEPLRRSWDESRERWWGDQWTGQYTRGGLIFTRGLIFVFGVFLAFIGARMLIR